MTILPDGGLQLAGLEEQSLQPGTKGLPITEPLRQHMVGMQGWNVLAADTSLPVAVLKTSSLLHNLDWMRAFCARYDVVLAPHGKTTMSPQLFGAQLANGAWGITLATAPQVLAAARCGVRRVLLANELVAPADIRALLALLRDDPAFELFVLADSAEGVRRLSDAAAGAALGRPLPLLLELGIAGQRTGCRSIDDARALARMIAAAPGLQLAGIEGYEGLLVSDDRAADLERVNTFLAGMTDLARQLDAERLFGAPHILLTAGGSSYFDLVARAFGAVNGLSRPVLPVLRSGCYLTSDHGHYQELTAELDEREGSRGSAGEGLRPALEVWSVVLSRPEAGLAILSMGKRDASYDLGLPHVLAAHRPGEGPVSLPDGARIDKMNDQHAYLRLPEESGLRVGDLVGCGISHPCTTFDKWSVLLLVDDDYNVQRAINTLF
ncbi:amino acid deaminase [Pseudoduganella umbonata]|uniref:Amino acid deaminase n=1 Tax=Pseudoduganella umbonata TaxID=864828 RepID=A0A4P8HW88_9BURK|nr:amino acid deaminase [Pseudoduganella umbonata]MBB3223866.1 D-serine dehydratase [Pseudoduganella umbonata]QCP12724.1 amino acid deaminase [Pseudoduganella umbonata]